jgi:hypothetical protein
MSWMDDGGFEMTFCPEKHLPGELPMTRLRFNTSVGRFQIWVSETDVERIKKECERILNEYKEAW